MRFARVELGVRPQSPGPALGARFRYMDELRLLLPVLDGK